MSEEDFVSSHGRALIQAFGVRASACAGYHSPHRPRPLRFVWHHILPQTCGGRTTKQNLVSLCDNCHITVHSILWLIAQHQGLTANIIRYQHIGTEEQRELAERGYQAAVALGTVARIPNEGGAILG